MNYPADLYDLPTRTGGVYIDDQAQRLLVEHGYNIGARDGMAERPYLLDAFSNLTEAIKSGARIDFAQLDGRVAKCVHEDMGTLTNRLARSQGWDEATPAGWYETDKTGSSGGWGPVLGLAWFGYKGWQLWIEGDIPLKPKTADELETGTCFYGRVINPDTGTVSANLPNAQVLEVAGADERFVIQYSDDFLNVGRYSKLENIEVFREYGPGIFEK